MPIRKQTSRVGVLPARQKPHPQHRARVIRSLWDDMPLGWTVYPEQLPAMERALTRAILDRSDPGLRHLACVKSWATHTARACIKALGLVVPASQSRIENRKSKIR